MTSPERDAKAAPTGTRVPARKATASPTALLLRPHHFLCLIAFTGQGYSDPFIACMQALQNDFFKGAAFGVSRSADVICAQCPNREGRGCGASEGIPADELDARIAEALGLSSKNAWNYADIAARLSALSQDACDALCEGCSWFKTTNCTAIISKRIKAG